MNKTALYGVLIVVVVGLVLYLVANQTTSYNWHPNYSTSSNAPYGLKVFYSLMQKDYSVNPLKDRIEKTFPTDAGQGSAYVYIDRDAPWYTEQEVDILMNYVRRGGNVFIACGGRLPDTLIQYLVDYDDCDAYDRWDGRLSYTYADSIQARFTHPSISSQQFDFVFRRDGAPAQNMWHCIPARHICDNADYPMAQLGSVNLYGSDLNEPFGNQFNSISSENGFNEGNLLSSPANFVKIAFGEQSGAFYFHTMPLLFTNLYMVDPSGQGFFYAQNVFGHLDAETLIWDLPSREKPPFADLPDPIVNNIPRSESPMIYIYSQRSLRWGWYLLLAMGIIYAIFRAKRKQRIIPVIEPNNNTSLEFVQSIGMLYYQQQDHKSILIKQMELFLANARQKYHIVTRNWREDKKVGKSIALRADVPEETVFAIINQYKKLEPHLKNPRVEVSPETLNAFYVLVERFHKQANIPKLEKIKETVDS